MYGFQALIFDVDGTLADTERDGHRPAFNAAFAEAGLDWDWTVPVYGELLAVTGGKERIRYFIERWRPPFQPPADLDAFIADLHRRKTAHYLEMLRTGAIPLRPGVLRLLREARSAGVRLAIATTTTPENVTTLLECSGEPDLPGWFEVIAAGDIVPAKKPASDIYHYALEKMGLDPQACLAFEDSENGLRASLGAGLKTLITVNDYTRDHDFKGAAVVLSDLGDPGAPNRLIAGPDLGQPFVDVAYLRALHAG